MNRQTRADVVIIANNDLSHDSRVLKEAEALTAAGLRVYRIGISSGSCPQGIESTESGPVVRVDTRRRRSDRPVGEVETRVAADVAYAGRIGSARHWAGRQREAYLLYKAAKEYMPRVAICCDLPTLLAGRLLKGVGARVVYDVHDLYTEQGRGDSPLFQHLYRFSERRLLPSCDSLVTVSPEFSRWLVDTYRIESPPAVVYNGPSRCRSAEASSSGGRIRLLFQGRFGSNRNLRALVAAMDILGGTASLTLQGWGEEEVPLRKEIERLGLADAVQLREPCAPADVVRCAAEYDVGVIAYQGTTENLRLTVPNKLMDYIGAGLAVAASDLPGLRRIVEDTGCGVLIDPSSPATIAEGLRPLIENPRRIAEMKAASATACPLYAWSAQAEKLVGIVNALLAGDS